MRAFSSHSFPRFREIRLKPIILIEYTLVAFIGTDNVWSAAGLQGESFGR
jgi:hypothetical protein